MKYLIRYVSRFNVMPFLVNTYLLVLNIYFLTNPPLRVSLLCLKEVPFSQLVMSRFFDFGTFIQNGVYRIWNNELVL